MRRALAEVFARPEYRWTDAGTPLRGVASALGRFFSWLASLEHRHPAAARGLLIGLVVVVTALLLHLVYILWTVARPTARTPHTAPAAAPGGFDSARAHRDRADALARAGRYTEALSQRFLAVVLALDRDHALSFHRSKTPAEYLDESRLDDSGRRLLGDLVTRLYRHVFGAIPCDERTYREFVATAAAFEQ